jgi:hypothetical protein
VKTERPAGVSAAAIIFLLTGCLLLVLGVARLISPEAIPLSSAAAVLTGLELLGPWMFLAAAAATCLIGWGLLRLNNWARRAAVVVALAGIVMLVPSVSSSVFDVRFLELFWGGLGIIIRVSVAWYLFQPWVREAFERKFNPL